MTWRSRPLVIVPGLRGDVPEHWQSHLAAQFPHALTVDSSARDKRDLDGRVADLESVVCSLAEPATIVAHSAGVLVTVHWAVRHGGRVGGALLATPPDLSRPLPSEYPALTELAAAGWLPIPQQSLPFPSVVAVSSNDSLGDPHLVRNLARSWVSDVVDLGPVGHLNPASGYGPWPGVIEALDQLDALSRDRAPVTSG